MSRFHFDRTTIGMFFQLTEDSTAAVTAAASASFELEEEDKHQKVRKLKPIPDYLAKRACLAEKSLSNLNIFWLENHQR